MHQVSMLHFIFLRMYTRTTCLFYLMYPFSEMIRHTNCITNHRNGFSRDINGNDNINNNNNNNNVLFRFYSINLRHLPIRGILDRKCQKDNIAWTVKPRIDEYTQQYYSIYIYIYMNTTTTRILSTCTYSTHSSRLYIYT